jgi:copper chaperone NosL
MRIAPLHVVAGAILALVLAGCGENQGQAPKPAPLEPTAASVSYFCAMGVLEHGGPKGQIFLEGKAEPIWLSSVRDTLAFTMLPEEPKKIVAIYVNDLAKARNWDRPEAGDWVEARAAWYVLGSSYTGGMGDKEAVPFSDETAARGFAASHGGKVARFAEVPESYILESGPSSGAGDPGAAGD